MYISITRLELKSIWKLFQFYKYNGNVQRQIKSAKGLVSIDTKGTSFTNFYTLTSWESKEDMLAFVHSGAHLEAIRNSKYFASKITAHGIEAGNVPTWHEAIRMLDKKIS